MDRRDIASTKPELTSLHVTTLNLRVMFNQTAMGSLSGLVRSQSYTLRSVGILETGEKMVDWIEYAEQRRGMNYDSAVKEAIEQHSPGESILDVG